MAAQVAGGETLPKALTFADLESEAHAAVTQVIRGEFKGRSYDRSQAGKWVDDANTAVTEALQGLSKVRPTVHAPVESLSPPSVRYAEFQVCCQHNHHAKERCWT